MAEGLLRAALDSRGLASTVTVASAGLMKGGVRPARSVIGAVAPFGADISAHCSRAIARELIEEADLVIALAREHAQAVVRLCPDARRRSFTLKELSRLVERSSPRAPEDSFDRYVDALNDGRAADAGPADDVADPFGRPLEVLNDTAAEIDVLVRSVAMALWPERVAEKTSSRREADRSP